MKTNYVEIAELGLKFLVAVAGGLAVFAGLSKLVKNFHGGQQQGKSEGQQPAQQYQPEEPPIMMDDMMSPPPPYEQQPETMTTNENKPKDFGEKLVKGIQMSQVALMGLIGIVTGVSAVASNINRIFDPGYYNTMVNDPGASTGFFGTQVIPGMAGGMDYPWNQSQPPQAPYESWERGNGLPIGKPIFYPNSPGSKEGTWVCKRNISQIDIW